MSYCVTTALEKIREMDKKIRIVQGGTNAGKTIAILIDEINEAITQDKIITSIVSDTMPALKHGAMRDFLDICNDIGLLKIAEWNKTESTLTLPNRSIIEFFSTDSEDKVRGPKRTRLFINEANRVPWEAFSYMETATKQKVTIDYNPTSAFWAHNILMKDKAWKDAVDFTKVTYKDNESLDKEVVDAIERRRGDGTSNWWRVYGMGEIGSLEGNIYSGWTSLPEIPTGYVLKRYGVDFGFSNDPTAVVAVYENEDGAIFLKLMVYETKLLTPELITKCKMLDDALFVCDNARPEIIAEMQRAGIRAIGCDKTPGEKLNGKRYNIELVLRRKVNYLASDKEIEKEYLTYAWRKKKTGEQLDEPEDGNDHCLTGDTMIDTVHGQKKIKDLVGTSGYVFSESGKIRKYRNVRQTGIEDTIKITFDNGNTLECSKEHPIYTVNRGIVPAYLLNEHDLIQCIMYGESKNNIEYQTTVQRNKLLEGRKRKILSQRTAQTAHYTQSGLGVLQRKNTKGASDRPYRQRHSKQPDREFKSSYAIRKQQECVRRNKNKKSQECTKAMPKNESMACFRNREGMALRAWQENVREERANRHHLCSLWEKVLYHTIFKKSAFVQPSLPAKETQESKKRVADGLRRKNNKGMSVLRKVVSHIFPKAKVLLPEMQRQGKVRKIVKIEDTGEKPVYCMDVFDTSNFSVNGGIIVSNCMDALAYAVRDMERKPVEYAKPR